ncbi:TetR/AcrR family transcriptional regulator [Xylanimonas protaetiae]|uniref:TetR/AcrR family transcriptional regulator n=1 Tax=Xylanimonas protaetiae TaxID=2509457 RepID=A0A4V0YGD5_9MICO|nr:TetR/AcrR family transcriptional regulator [Xylanimonas protaetiae]QAY70831.1 TetR/AcrR family transcriptional regulator [Xylanimonas protaetiae]
MPSSQRTTPERILAAAGDEFAEHGLAGARVDRIAARAGANKERIYANFGGKDALFDRVLADRIAELLDTVPFDADDLPGYAERLFRFTVERSDLTRLLLWHTLERPGRLATIEPGASSQVAKMAALAAALEQRTDLDRSQTPDRLLGQVLGVVYGAALGVLASGTTADEAAADVRRSVERVIAP